MNANEAIRLYEKHVESLSRPQLSEIYNYIRNAASRGGRELYYAFTGETSSIQTSIIDPLLQNNYKVEVEITPSNNVLHITW